MITCKNGDCEYYLEDICEKDLNDKIVKLDREGICKDFKERVNDAYLMLDNGEKLTNSFQFICLNKKYHAIRKSNYYKVFPYNDSFIEDSIGYYPIEKVVDAVNLGLWKWL